MGQQKVQKLRLGVQTTALLNEGHSKIEPLLYKPKHQGAWLFLQLLQLLGCLSPLGRCVVAFREVGLPVSVRLRNS